MRAFVNGEVQVQLNICSCSLYFMNEVISLQLIANFLFQLWSFQKKKIIEFHGKPEKNH